MGRHETDLLERHPPLPSEQLVDDALALALAETRGATLIQGDPHSSATGWLAGAWLKHRLAMGVALVRQHTSSADDCTA